MYTICNTTITDTEGSKTRVDFAVCLQSESTIWCGGGIQQQMELLTEIYT